MDVKLKVLSGKHAGKEVALVQPKFLIGRADDCHLRAGSDLISRHHCVLSCSTTELTIKDLGSRNGTLVNEERITERRVLKSGDQLKVGPLEFEVVITVVAEQSTTAPTTVHPGKPAKKIDKIVQANAAVAKANRNVEDSICAWLGEPDAKNSTVASADTQAIKSSGALTDQIELSKTAAPEQAPDSGKKPPGKLPPIPPQAKAKDSREAAANILREMSKRR